MQRFNVFNALQALRAMLYDTALTCGKHIFADEETNIALEK